MDELCSQIRITMLCKGEKLSDILWFCIVHLKFSKYSAIDKDQEKIKNHIAVCGKCVEL